MTNQPPQCGACLVKDAIIAAQAIEIADLKAVIKRLKAIITRALAVCAAIIKQADAVMADHQPRGTWAMFKGRKEAAENIKRYLHF